MVTPTGHCNDWSSRILFLDYRNHSYPAQFGHHQVGYHEIDAILVLFDSLQARNPIVSRYDFIILGKKTLQGIDNICVVVDYENPMFSTHFIPQGILGLIMI
jgi:hypothetical protein